MSRPLRIEFADAVYHVSARGNAGQTIFLKDGDRRAFIELLGREVAQHRWRCHGFCLLDDQYRLLIETPEANLGRGIGRLNAMYSQWFNRRHGRVGHLFQGRYKAIVIEKAVWIARLARDLAWAPVHAGLAKRPGHWEWSSHRLLAKNRQGPPWLVIDDILAEFAGAPEGTRKAYRLFVAEGKNAPSPWASVRAQMYLGSEAFLRSMAERARSRPSEQIPRAMLCPDRPTRETIIDAVATAAGVAATTALDRHARQDVFRVTVYLLRRAANLSLKEVAALAGVSPPRVSQIQRAIEEAGGLVRVFSWTQPLAIYLP
ncbi:MAG: helix-turn-helix transcriptional regulator [Rhodospirillales bacterium]|nr:helix-turn-helix transcriptional regulator [Rhodospirillales bacterium]